MAEKGERPSDRIVLICVLILLVAGDLLSHGALGRQLLDWVSAPALLHCAAASLLGFAVGFAELVSRYRDEPWGAAAFRPGLIFIALNGLASTAALLLLWRFPDTLRTPADPVAQVMMAGFGAMVVIRTKLLTVHQPGGTEIAVGPAFILDTILAAINRDVDRRRAVQRTRRVAERAAELRGYKYADANDYLIASLAAFQNMDEEVARNLRSQLKDLVEHDALKKMSDELKFVMAGYSILTEFGDRTFDSAFSSLEAYLKALREQAGGASK